MAAASRSAVPPAAEGAAGKCRPALGCRHQGRSGVGLAREEEGREGGREGGERGKGRGGEGGEGREGREGSG